MNSRRMVTAVAALLVLLAALAMLAWLRQQVPRAAAPTRLPGEAMMDSYGSPETAPIEDLVALHRLLADGFPRRNDRSRQPIAGNDDLAAALRGETDGYQACLPAGHAVFGPDGRLVDRWGTPLSVTPVAAGAIELRSAGPDLRMFSGDDLVVTAGGNR